jgi:ABC-type antimicrobial peptide transport system permease subunit
MVTTGIIALRRPCLSTNWPGLGRLLVDSVEMRDYPVIQAEVLLFSLEFIRLPSPVKQSHLTYT